MGGHDQDVLVVGDVQSEGDDFSILVHDVFPQTTVRGITVGKRLPFSSSGAVKNGNTYLLSLQRSGTGYTVAWGAFEVTGNALADMRLADVRDAEDAALQEFIRSGGKEKDFFFQGETGFVRRAGVSMQIYPATEDALDPTDPVSVVRVGGFVFWIIMSGAGLVVFFGFLLMQWRKL